MAAQKFMFKISPTGLAVWALLTFSLAACGGAKTPAPEAVFTSAAQTAQARSTELFAQTPTVDPASMVATIAAPTPTPTDPATAAPAAAQPATPGQAATTPAAGATQAAPPASAGADAALYVTDVTIPDGTTFAPGETFEKVWRIQNSGSTTWTSAYSLVFIDGELMGAQTAIPLADEVAPGEEIEITVAMTAPEKAGIYTGYWKMTTANGKLFGFGAAGTEAIWVKISVSGASAETPEAAATSGSTAIISDAWLSVDNASVSGPCPHTFNFSGQITLSKAAAVTYLMEAGSNAGNTLHTPLPVTRNLSPGSHAVVYEMTVAESFSGWARLHITAPIDLVSEPVNIDLTCG